MPVMTILGCRMFEDELVHLIENDPEIEELIVVENKDSGSFVQKLIDTEVAHTLVPLEEIPKISERGGGGKFVLMIDLLEFALDAKPDLLKEEVYKRIEEIVEYSDSILIFYGLCGNVLGNVEKDFEASPCLVSILKDEDGEIVDDCICVALGGRSGYLNALKGSDDGGTYFLTPMQAAYWGEMVVIAGLTPDPDNIEMTKMVFDYSGYKNVARIDTGLSYEKDFDEKVDEFAKLFDFDIVELKGDLGLVEKCYERSKAEILN